MSSTEPSRTAPKGLEVTFEGEQGRSGEVNIGLRLKELRTRKGLSQTEMAKLVGVTPSTISQVERSQIYPSLPALFKMAEILSVEAGALFRKTGLTAGQVVFKEEDAVSVQLPGAALGPVQAKLLTGVGHESKVEPYLIEIPPKTKLIGSLLSPQGRRIRFSSRRRTFPEAGAGGSFGQGRRYPLPQE